MGKVFVHMLRESCDIPLARYGSLRDELARGGEENCSMPEVLA